MKELDPATQPSGPGFHDILFIVYKHKWKVILCFIAGLAAAAVCYFTDTPLYESDAKLLVRYVVDRSAVDPVEGANASATKLSEAAIYSEIEILTSWDLYEQVAESVGIDRLMSKSKGPVTKAAAARVIASGVTVSARGAGVIVVSYKNSDPELAVLVLDALLKSYFTKHLDIHRSKATFDLVSQQNELLRSELAKTEDDLKKKKAEAGIISVTDTAAAINSEVSTTEQEMNAARTELARQTALVLELQKAYGTSQPEPPNPGKASKDGEAPKSHAADKTSAPTGETEKRRVNSEVVEAYEACLDEIAALKKKGIELRSRYNHDSIPVKSNAADLSVLELQRHDLERRYPELLEKAGPAVLAQDHRLDLSMEKAKLASLQAGMQILETRLHNVQERAKEFARIAPEIEDLERNKQLQQSSYTNSRSKLESASVDEALDPSKIPNISTVQKPSPAMRVISTRQKMILGLCGGGLALGLALAMFSEFVLDQTIKRPLELETLGIPLLLSIPNILATSAARCLGLNGGGNSAAKNGDDPQDGQLSIAPWEDKHFIRYYSEVVRDRLNLFFELNNLTHRPKMIAVTGFSRGCGVSTLAAGVAAALSETGDGKVLLVDMNVGQTEIHPFFQGKPACNLTAALGPDKQIASAAENLYLAKGVESENATAPVRFKRFHDLIPHFKGSDFDYIIFDMPPVGQTSPTSGMARFMDKVLFVVESEKSNKKLVQRAFTHLVDGRKNVSIVLNKVRSHAPRWLEGEL